MSKNEFTSNQILPHKKLNPKYNRFEFSQEELNELKAAFQVFEDEEKGKITPRNIIKIFQSLGYDNNNQNIMNMLQYLETNSVDGKIGFEEFLEGCNKYLGKNTPESDQMKIFRMFSESDENV
jgi:Ca2+-binding EF-hand superfamily protein